MKFRGDRVQWRAVDKAHNCMMKLGIKGMVGRPLTERKKIS